MSVKPSFSWGEISVIILSAESAGIQHAEEYGGTRIPWWNFTLARTSRSEK